MIKLLYCYDPNDFIKEVAIKNVSHQMAVLLLHMRSSSDVRVKDLVIHSAAY